MREHVEQLHMARRLWLKRGWPEPSALVVSGSGLAADLTGSVIARADLAELVPFPVRSVPGHPHRLELVATECGVILYQRGRLHAYQGYDANETAFVVRLAGLLGAGSLLMTNAAGGLRSDQSPGQLFVITDQINLIGLNPLRGEIPAEWGPQFPDMTGAHDPVLRADARTLAKDLDIELGAGVYAGVAGPSFETPAEVEMLRRLGADLVGMSTVLEVIAARHLGMRSLCISLVSNLAAGIEDRPVDHEEVLAASGDSALLVARLVDAIVGLPHFHAPRRSES